MIRPVCDGCGCTDDEHVIVELCIVVKRHYCETCSVVITEYLTQRDALHDECVKKWAKGLEKLQNTYSMPLPV